MFTFITIMCLIGSGFWIVQGDKITLPDIFVSIGACHKIVNLYENKLDDETTNGVIDSLNFLDQPFEFHTTQYKKQIRFDDLTSNLHFTCLAHIVVINDSNRLIYLMNLLLQRFNRARGNEHDFVLVFAQSHLEISKRTDWTVDYRNNVQTENLPDNALLIGLDYTSASGNAVMSQYVSDVYSLELYCDEEQEVCWRPRSFNGYPKHKVDFDAVFRRQQAQWRYDYNGWPIRVVIPGVKNIDDAVEMSFGEATCGRYTREDYMWNYDSFHAPKIWLTFQIANHINATLEPYRFDIFNQRTEIIPGGFLRARYQIIVTPKARNVFLKFAYYTFGYCTNVTAGTENTSMIALFTPLDFISWILLGVMMIAMAIVARFAGHGFLLFQLASCLGCQSFSVNGRLAALFLLWHMVAFLIFNIYSAFLESVLVVPTPLPRIQDFQELNESCKVTWVDSISKDEYFLKEKFSGVPHLKDLMDRSHSYKNVFSIHFFRYLVEHENQCAIMMKYNSQAPWHEIGEKFEPGATCSEGKEKLIGDPYTWTIYQPNAAVVYRTIRALEAAGVLKKFSEYFENKDKQRMDHFVTNRLQIRNHYLMENKDEQHSDIHNIGGFTMKHIQIVFRACFFLNLCGFCVCVFEFSTSFVEISYQPVD